MKLNLTLLILLVSTFACKKKEKPFDYGHVEDNTYVNSFFGVELKLPPNWVIASSEQIAQLKEKGKALLTEDNKEMKAVIKASDVSTAALLMISKFEIGAPEATNPNMIINAENIIAYPGTKTGADYLYHAKKILKNLKVNFEVDSAITKEIFGGREFYRMTARLNVMTGPISQAYYSTIIDGFAFNLIFTYFNEEEGKYFHELLKQIKFKK